MDYIQTTNKQVDKFGVGKHGFSAGNPSGGVLATMLSSIWCDGLQQEIINVIEAAGIAPSGATLNQLLTALRSSGVFQTPTQFDSTTKAATTAFVQRALGNYQNQMDNTLVNLNMTPSMVGSIVVSFPSAASTINLPNPTAVAPGSMIKVVNTSGNVITVNTPAGLFYGFPTNGSGTASIAVAAGSSIEFSCDASNWTVVGGSMMSVPVAPQFDNSGKVANTAWVQRALGNFQVGLQINANTTLTSANAGTYFQFTGPYTATLPPYSSMPNGSVLYFWNNGGSSCVVQRSGADILADGSIAKTLGQYDSLMLVAEGGVWQIAGGSLSMKASDALSSSSQAASGWTRLSSGVIIQWGSIPAISANASQSITYPIAFPNNFYAIAGIAGAVAAGAPSIAGVDSSGTGNPKAGFKAWNSSTTLATLGGTYIAIGN